MPRTLAHKPRYPNNDVPDEFEPGAPPVEPDEGPTPIPDPGNPERDGDQHPGAHPARSARARRSAGPRGAKAPRSVPGLALPHERDESTPATAAVPDPVMVQAKRDLDAGLVDTDMRATPGLDADRRSRLVPGAGGKPPSSGS
ncbi:hypothetical protein [Ideonella sp. A 288]|uniref:hypothetical protein n=1 Tax=Ideonella sp. A 288 TaxID=1962181 RepID=UPI000B4ADD21|nr:hypothetical protein [Ideonella sp. A 288]